MSKGLKGKATVMVDFTKRLSYHTVSMGWGWNLQRLLCGSDMHRVIHFDQPKVFAQYPDWSLS
jgi:hypothetical protein